MHVCACARTARRRNDAGRRGVARCLTSSCGALRAIIPVALSAPPCPSEPGPTGAATGVPVAVGQAAARRRTQQWLVPTSSVPPGRDVCVHALRGACRPTAADEAPAAASCKPREATSCCFDGRVQACSWFLLANHCQAGWAGDAGATHDRWPPSAASSVLDCSLKHTPHTGTGRAHARMHIRKHAHTLMPFSYLLSADSRRSG